MARSKRRRTIRRRRGTRGRSAQKIAPKGRFPILAVLGGAVGVGALLLWRSSSEASTASSMMQTTNSLPSGVNATVPRSSGSGSQDFQYQNGQPIIPSSIANALQTSEQARRAFAVESLIYSFGRSNQAPDGQVSTVNGELRELAGLGAAVGPTLSGSSLAEVRMYLFGQDPHRTLRALPFLMPQSLIDLVNQSSASVDSQFIYLQALAVTPAGMPLAPAG